ncbi:MAG: AI-2E family transporter [Chloroflexi bacterium]|nr:AI-2E family transporter [Chloroflexota bacterium]
MNRDTLRRQWRLTLVIACVVAFIFVYGLRSAVFPFLLGLALAYILLPIISWTEKLIPCRGKCVEVRRVSSIAIIYTVVLGLATLFAVYLFNAVAQAFSILMTSTPDHYATAVVRLQSWTDSIRQVVPAEIRTQIDSFVTDAGATIANVARQSITNGIKMIPTTIGMVLGLAALPVFLFYLLKDRDKLSNSFYSAMPRWAQGHARNIVAIIERVLGQYIRASLTLGFVVGTLVLTGLLIIGVPFAPILAILAGVTELIPTIGPWIGAITGVIVTLALAPDKVLWVIILYIAVQLLENTLLVPRIQSAYLHIHPAVTIVLLAVGAYVAGFWGLLLAVPLTATSVEIYKYISNACSDTPNPSDLVSREIPDISTKGQ